MIDGPSLVVILLGIAVGITELLTRYTDSPWATLRTPSAVLYLAINGFVAYLALFVLRRPSDAQKPPGAAAETSFTPWQAPG